MVGALGYVLHELLPGKVFIFEVAHKKVVPVWICCLQSIDYYNRIALFWRQTLQSFKTILEISNTRLKCRQRVVLGTIESRELVEGITRKTRS